MRCPLKNHMCSYQTAKIVFNPNWPCFSFKTDTSKKKKRGGGSPSTWTSDLLHPKPIITHRTPRLWSCLPALSYLCKPTFDDVVRLWKVFFWCEIFGTLFMQQRSLLPYGMLKGWNILAILELRHKVQTGCPRKSFTLTALNFRSLSNIYANFRNIWKAWFNNFLKLHQPCKSVKKWPR